MLRAARPLRTPSIGNWRAGSTCGAYALARDASSVPVRARSFAAWRARATCSEPLFGKGFDPALHVREELVGHRAIDDAVVERNREVRTRPDGDGVFAVGAGDDLRTLLDGADAENANLGLAD